MKTLIFIHGGESFTSEAEYQKFLRETYISWQSNPWTPEVKLSWTHEIAKKWYVAGNQVFMPVFPNTLNAKYQEWKLVFEGILAQLNPDDEFTLVGGSLGGCFLLKYFSELSQKDSHFVVAIHHGREESLSKSPDANLMSTFSKVQEKEMSPTGQKKIRLRAIHLVAACIAEGDFTAPTNYDFLRSLGNRVHIWHAEDDMIVPFVVGQELSRTLPDAVFHPFSPERGYGHFHGIPAFPELEGEISSFESTE